jgi:hypothetical protein
MPTALQIAGRAAGSAAILNVVQMGCGRAGWYSHDRLDNGGRPSAERIVPEWQRPMGEPVPVAVGS